MKPKYLPEITGEDTVRFLKEDAEPISKAQKDHVDRCRKKYEEYLVSKC